MWVLMFADFPEHKMGYFTQLACWDVPREQVSFLLDIYHHSHQYMFLTIMPYIYIATFWIP